MTNDQLRAADRELREVEALYISAQQAPDGDPRKQQAIAMLEQRGLQLGYMLNARTMLNNARRAVIAKARKAPPEIDWAVSADRDLIVQSLKGASAPHDFKQPPPPFGRMSDAEFRNYTKDNYGF